MEHHLAILMADLSGYTALTETHGAVAAADLIDKYIDIVQKNLNGDCYLHERTGDEVMIVSESPDCLLVTAIQIGKRTAQEENFLQVHGGLHYGKVLKRNNSYFGTAINVTSRIAAKATAGSYWCSEEFAEALTEKSVARLISKGQHTFKNINHKKEVFELDYKHAEDFYIDPVCRMLILDVGIAIAHPSEAGQYFCSEGCLHIFNDRSKSQKIISADL